MAILYLLRSGSGRHRISHQSNVRLETVKETYGRNSVIRSVNLPTFNGEELAKFYSEPEVAVVELKEGEDAFGDFVSPGFNLLEGVDPREAFHQLVPTESEIEQMREELDEWDAAPGGG